jgi:hypothetical protein
VRPRNQYSPDSVGLFSFPVQNSLTNEPAVIEIITELLCRCHVQNGSVMEQSAFKMGCYGAEVLWCVRERGLGTFITFRGVQIARREEGGTWFALEPGWTVTPAGMSEVHIRLNGSDGVILPYRVGKR